MPTFTIGWESNVEPADAPPTSLKEDGLAPARLPAALLNWLLVGLTSWIDDYLLDLAKTYVHLKHYRACNYVGSNWSNALVTGTRGLARQTATQAAEDTGCAIVPLDIPHGVTHIEWVRVRIKPATGHSTVPTTMPKFQLVSVNVSTGAQTTVATATDDIVSAGSSSGGDITAYEAYHPIEYEAAPLAVNPETTALAVLIYGEAGSGSAFQAGLEVRDVEVQYRYNLASQVESGTVVP